MQDNEIKNSISSQGIKIPDNFNDVQERIKKTEKYIIEQIKLEGNDFVPNQYSRIKADLKINENTLAPVKKVKNWKVTLIGVGICCAILIPFGVSTFFTKTITPGEVKLTISEYNDDKSAKNAYCSIDFSYETDGKINPYYIYGDNENANVIAAKLRNYYKNSRGYTRISPSDLVSDAYLLVHDKMLNSTNGYAFNFEVTTFNENCEKDLKQQLDLISKAISTDTVSFDFTYETVISPYANYQINKIFDLAETLLEDNSNFIEGYEYSIQDFEEMSYAELINVKKLLIQTYRSLITADAIQSFKDDLKVVYKIRNDRKSELQAYVSEALKHIEDPGVLYADGAWYENDISQVFTDEEIDFYTQEKLDECKLPANPTERDYLLSYYSAMDLLIDNEDWFTHAFNIPYKLSTMELVGYAFSNYSYITADDQDTGYLAKYNAK